MPHPVRHFDDTNLAPRGTTRLANFTSEASPSGGPPRGARWIFRAGRKIG